MLVLQIFLVGTALNIVWEFSHCWLYETCRRQSWQKNVPLLLVMAIKDGFFILLFYLLSARLFGVTDILNAPASLIAFIMLSSGFAFVDEKISLRLKRWEYAPAMPTLFGVGITPLLEIAVTGVLTFILVFSGR